MYTYVVSYDLINPGQDYTKLYDAINTYRNIKILESCYIIKSSTSSFAISYYLRCFMDSNDRLFVAKLDDDVSFNNLLHGNTNIKSFIQS